MGYAGTVATYGRGRAVVVATGMDTEFGKIANMLQTIETGRTPLQENLDRVGAVLARAAFVIVGIIVILGLLRGQDFVEMLIFGVALAVAVVPEALPAVVTISLVHGEDDEIVPIDEARQIFAARGEAPVELMTVSGDHESFADLEHHMGRLVAFLGRVLGGDEARR